MTTTDVKEKYQETSENPELRRGRVFKRRSIFSCFSNGGTLKVRWLKAGISGFVALCFLYKVSRIYFESAHTNKLSETAYRDDFLEYENEIDYPSKHNTGNTIRSPLLPPNIYLTDSTTKRPLAKFHITPWHVLDALGSPIQEQNCKNMKMGIEHGARFAIVIFVKSKLKNVDERNLIRETWGSVYYMKQIRIEKVFVVGKIADIETQNHIDLEATQYGDILQYKGNDSYQNLPNKVTAAMQWASTNLPDDFFYASTDDDFIVNFSRVLDFLEYDIHKRWDHYTAVKGRQVSKREVREILPLYCVDTLFINDIPDPNYLSKRHISHSQYEFEYFPPYCGGGFYFMPVSMTKQLFKISRVTSQLHLDDVWVTGILRQKLLLGDTNIIKVQWPIMKSRLIWKHFSSKRLNSGLMYKLIKRAWFSWEEEIIASPHCIQKHKPIDISVVNAMKDRNTIDIV